MSRALDPALTACLMFSRCVAQDAIVVDCFFVDRQKKWSEGGRPGPEVLWVPQPSSRVFSRPPNGSLRARSIHGQKNVVLEGTRVPACAGLHLQVADLEDQPALLAHDPDLPGLDAGLTLATARVSGLRILFPSASQKRTLRKSSLHFRKVVP